MSYSNENIWEKKEVFLVSNKNIWGKKVFFSSWQEGFVLYKG